MLAATFEVETSADFYRTLKEAEEDFRNELTSSRKAIVKKGAEMTARITPIVYPAFVLLLPMWNPVSIHPQRDASSIFF